MNRIILKRDQWGFYNAQNIHDENSPLNTLTLLASDLGGSVYSYIEMLEKRQTPYTERCHAENHNKFITLKDYFAEVINEQIIQLTLTRENLIQILKKWDELAKEKVDTIILAHHDDGTVTIEGK